MRLSANRMNPPIKWPSWFVLTRHWLSLAGAALVTTAVISWLFVLPLQIRGHANNPYVGIVVFLILPAIFFVGLLLMPVGVYLARRQIRQSLTEPAFVRKVALQRLAWFVGIRTALARRSFGSSRNMRKTNKTRAPGRC